MEYPTLRFVFNRKKKATKSTAGDVELEITFNRRQKRYATGVKIYIDEWHNKDLVINREDAMMLNMKLEKFKKPFDAYVMERMIRNEPFDLQEMADSFKRQWSRPRLTFLEFVEERIANRTDICESTRKSHNSLTYALKRYPRIRVFDDLSMHAISCFDAWLRSRDLKTTTIAKYHKIMKTYIHEAIVRGYMERDPYLGFKVDKGKPKDRKYLTSAELQTLKDCKLEDQSLLKVRDLFIFQSYTGLGYADLTKFDFTKAEERNGKYVVRDIRQKTGQQFYIVLLSPAVEILRRYDWQLPLMSNQKYNTYLKSLGVLIGKPITSHCARHTFATWCLNNGIDIETLAKFLGHTDTKSTREYAKIVDKTIEDAFDDLEKLIS